MTAITREAPPWGGASVGDSEEYNQPDRSTPDPHGREHGPIVADAMGDSGVTPREYNRMVADWADQFDWKFRKVCRILGWMADRQTHTAHFRIKKFRQRYRGQFKADIHRATVFRHLAELEKAGVIKRHQQYRPNGSQRSSKYEINYAYVIKGGQGVYIGPPEEALCPEVSPAKASPEPERDWCLEHRGYLLPCTACRRYQQERG